MVWSRHLIAGFLCGLAWAISAAVASDQTASRPANTAQHWAYQPIAHPHPPAVRDERWVRGDIDRFILARIEGGSLSPVADADHATLVRRVYFDLTGMAPTPEQISSFVHDASPDRYTRLVDRLLASREYGERWARHWLDVARFGESLTLRGFLLKDGWRYRDYVIEAFNQDRPFDRFMQEQVSGDLLPANSVQERRRGLIATEFLTLGNINLEEQDKKQLEMDVVDEQINTIGTAFLAQTIGCARCHDHKFDPIPTRDYYALAGILHSTESLKHANVSSHIQIPLPEEPERELAIEKHEAAVAELRAKLGQAKLALARANAKNGKAAGGPILAVADLPGIVVDDAMANSVGQWIHSTSAKPYIGNGYLTDNGDRSESKTLTFQPEKLESGRYEVRFAYTPAENRATNVSVTVFSAEGDKKIFVNEREYSHIDGHFVSLGFYNFEKNGQAYVLVSNENADGHVVADAVQFLPSDASSSAEANSTSPAPIDANVASVKQLEADLKKLIALGPNRETIDSVRENSNIADTRINVRGNVHSLGETVPRGFLHAVSMDHALAIPQTESGRRELGEWLADRQNPLPARVMANRVWHWLFGVGIVRTVDNFGSTGEAPANPELLDYLATRFVDENWSVKSLVRQIVLSHAYQLSSADDATNLAADPENRLVWRMNRRRLDAECIRDTMLSISGQLTPCAGGSLYKPKLSSDFGYKQTDPVRSIYLPAFRNARPELLEAFDCADPSVSTGRRNTSTVAPQALFMLNSEFVIDQSRKAADRLLKDETCPDDVSRLMQAYQLTLSRAPSDGEKRAVMSFLQSADAGQAQESWEQVFHALFASIDFRYVN